MNEECKICKYLVNQIRRLQDAHFEGAKEIASLSNKIQQFQSENERLREKFNKILNWTEAYPIEVFPELTKDEWEHAAKVLKENGLSLDRISSNNMNFVLKGIKKII